MADPGAAEVPPEGYGASRVARISRGLKSGGFGTDTEQ
jgi:hypothetical protein